MICADWLGVSAVFLVGMAIGCLLGYCIGVYHKDTTS
jgi:membrane protein DedA with SNARE-associated domain